MKMARLTCQFLNYLKNVIAECPVMITGKAAMPAADDLFTMRDGRRPGCSRRKGHWCFTTRLYS